jgi:uncharacterized membrane protein
MGTLHPEVVHFAIALLVVGVLLRALSLWLLSRASFVGPAATLLLTLGTVAVVAAAWTGDAAHAPVEAMPGLRPVVTEHEQWGEWTRNIFLVVLLIELTALVVRVAVRQPLPNDHAPTLIGNAARYLMIASAVVGAVGLVALYEAGEHGGEIVYGYGGGVGTRSGDPADVQRLLLAGLYQQALVDRKAGRADAAAALIDQAAQRFGDIEVQLLRAESLLLDRKDPAAALAALRGIRPPADDRSVRIRHGMLTADALVATGQRDGAIAMLQQLAVDTDSPRVQQRLDELKQPGGASSPQ